MTDTPNPSPPPLPEDWRRAPLVWADFGPAVADPDEPAVHRLVSGGDA
jgi:hypothetical protein